MSDHACRQISDALTSLFFAASEAAARRVAAAGWPLTVTAQKMQIERNQEKLDNWWSSTHEQELNVIAHRDTPLHMVAPLLSSEVAAAVVQCASSIAAMPESNLPFWSPFPGRGVSLLMGGDSDAQSTYAGTPNDLDRWVMDHLLLPALLAHLANLSSLDTVSDDAARQFAADVLRLVTADKLFYCVNLPLAGIDVRDSSGVVRADGDVSVRLLDATEQGEMLEGGLGFPPVGSFETLPHVALEVRVSTPRDVHNPDVHEELAKWLCALQLHGFYPAGSTATIEAEPNWAMAGRLHNPVLLPSKPHKWQPVDGATLQKIKTTVNHLKQHQISEPRSERDLALHRFCLGLARETGVDAVLDFTISLEALLLPYDKQARRGDLGYRFRMHGAHYLSEGIDGRKDVERQLARLYELRSRLVHGGKYPAKAEIEDTRRIAEQLARSGLIQAVTSGFPSATTFRDMVLGV